MGAAQLMHLIPDAVETERLQFAISRDGTPTVLLVTCNRVECVWLGESSSPDDVFVDCMRERAAAHGGALLETAIVRYEGLEALRHLLRVATGLESQLQGDSDILGQVRISWAAARSQGFTSTALDRVFERVVNSTRHVRLHAGFDDASRTIGRAAADVLAERLDTPWQETRVLVLGSGAAATSALDALQRYEPAELAVSSRTDARAEDVARKRGNVRCVAWSDREPAIANADVVVFALRTEQPLASEHNVSSLVTERANRALWADLGMPPNVQPTVQHDSLEILSLGTLMTWRELEVASADRALAALEREHDLIVSHFERRRQRLTVGATGASRVPREAAAPQSWR